MIYVARSSIHQLVLYPTLLYALSDCFLAIWCPISNHVATDADNLDRTPKAMSLKSNDGKDVLRDNQSGRLSLMETEEDLLASQELPPPKLDYCVECKDQEVNHLQWLRVATTPNKYTFPLGYLYFGHN